MLRRLGGLLATIVLAVNAVTSSVGAIDTVPSVQPKVDGPLLISSYSFSGHTVRYVQMYNSSDAIVNLAGWKVEADWAGDSWVSQDLNGLMAPKTKLLVAEKNVVSSANFTFAATTAAADPRITTLKLIPPSSSNWLEHAVSISINDTTGASRTVRVATVPDTFYFARNISTSTGNFLSTFTSFVPTSNFTLEADALYTPPASAPLKIVEVYPDASACAPGEVSLLCQDYVKLQNISSDAVDLAKYRLRVGSAGQVASSSNTAYLSGVLAAGAFVSFPLSLTDSGNWVWLEDIYGLVRYDTTTMNYPSASGHEAWGWSFNPTAGKWQWTQFPTPANEANQFSSSGVVNTCNGLRLSEIAANVDKQFIEVYNPTPVPLDVSGCQLQTNRSQTANYTFPDGTNLAPLTYGTVYVADTPLSLTKTTTGTVYLLSSDGATEADARYYENLDENTSFALVGGTWEQTFTVTPNEENVYAAYPACEVGYERNLETGRCNKIEVIPTQKPCLSTQYRNPETGRCKNLSASTIGLTPCLPGQYRNPQTNRCRNATTVTSTLKPCGPNQERNPTTNRCRNIVKTVNADFPVEAVASAGSGTVGWWAFGGVGILAVGYAGWEWRREVLGFIRKAAFFLPSGK